MLCWAFYWYGRGRNAYRLLMGKLVANIHMAGRKGEGRMMLRWVLDRACAWEVNGTAKDSIRVGLWY
jgi:hypothetical protein